MPPHLWQQWQAQARPLAMAAAAAPSAYPLHLPWSPTAGCLRWAPHPAARCAAIKRM